MKFKISLYLAVMLGTVLVVASDGDRSESPYEGTVMGPDGSPVEVRHSLNPPKNTFQKEWDDLYTTGASSIDTIGANGWDSDLYAVNAPKPSPKKTTKPVTNAAAARDDSPELVPRVPKTPRPVTPPKLLQEPIIDSVSPEIRQSVNQKPFNKIVPAQQSSQPENKITSMRPVQREAFALNFGDDSSDLPENKFGEIFRSYQRKRGGWSDQIVLEVERLAQQVTQELQATPEINRPSVSGLILAFNRKMAELNQFLNDGKSTKSVLHKRDPFNRANIQNKLEELRALKEQIIQRVTPSEKQEAEAQMKWFLGLKRGKGDDRTIVIDADGEEHVNQHKLILLYNQLLTSRYLSPEDKAKLKERTERMLPGIARAGIVTMQLASPQDRFEKEQALLRQALRMELQDFLKIDRVNSPEHSQTIMQRYDSIVSSPHATPEHRVLADKHMDRLLSSETHAWWHYERHTSVSTGGFEVPYYDQADEMR